MTNQSEWKESAIELPPMDGSYEVTNNLATYEEWCNGNIPIFPYYDVISHAHYDGYGFLYCGVYREPLYWREYKPREKIYGKRKED